MWHWLWTAIWFKLLPLSPARTKRMVEASERVYDSHRLVMDAELFAHPGARQLRERLREFILFGYRYLERCAIQSALAVLALPCGHPVSSVVASGRGPETTNHCGACAEREA